MILFDKSSKKKNYKKMFRVKFMLIILKLIFNQIIDKTIDTMKLIQQKIEPFGGYKLNTKMHCSIRV